MAQLPSGSEGAAAGVLLWSLICLLCNVLLLWLLWTSKERGSYLFWISLAAFIATITSIIQQINTIVNYEDIMRNRLRFLKSMIEGGIPVVVATNSQDTGPDKVLAAMRWACFLMEACLGFAWSFQLMLSVYGLMQSPSWERALSFLNRIGKSLAILLPILVEGLLQLRALKRDTVWYLITYDILYVTSCAGALFMIGLIFVEYIQTRLLSLKMVGSEAKFGALQQKPSCIHDRWLVVRVTIPMVALSAFEGYNITNQLQFESWNAEDVLASEPDLTASTAVSSFTQFMPGCLASLMLLLCFGTTRQFRSRIYKTFVPMRFQRMGRANSFSSTTASYAPMDDDPGVLSRQRRLSVERGMKIKVTTELEIKLEVLDKPGILEYKARSGYHVDHSIMLHPSWHRVVPGIFDSSEFCIP